MEGTERVKIVGFSSFVYFTGILLHSLKYYYVYMHTQASAIIQLLLFINIGTKKKLDRRRDRSEGRRYFIVIAGLLYIKLYYRPFFFLSLIH